MKHLLLIVTLIVFSGVCAAEDVQVVFATGEWLPYTSETLPEYGAATALVSAICRAGGIQPVYQFYPWKRAEQMVADGEVFAAFPYVISDERKTAYDFSDIFFYGVNVFVYYEKNPKTAAPVPYDTLDDLRGYRIGGFRGAFWEPVFEKAGLPYQDTTTVDQSIRKLVADRLDLCIDNQVVLYDAIQRLFPDDIAHFKTLPKPFGEKMPNALLVSRTYPEAQDILKKFNEGLAIMKQNGEYDRLIEKYHMTK